MPSAASVNLVLDPTKETFQGKIELTARVAEPLRFFWLHAERLTIEQASAQAGGKSYPLEVVTPRDELAGFRSATPIPAGDVVVTISYQGKLDDKETDGIFRQKEGEEWYLFTQFESVMARRAFPCFDEPDAKATWQLTLEVPERLHAFANTPEVSVVPTGRGTKAVTFARTRPLPSYLVAFAAGAFDVVDGGKVSSKGVSFRVIVPKGHGGDVGFVLSSTPPVLALLEEYFGTPYPFEKLDLVAVPLTASFGAMENPGLVTYNQSWLVAREQDFTIGFQRRFVSVNAHELAHQWFGDLVTMAWWDDLWLNESFAEWMADKIVRELKPEWKADIDAVATRNTIMGSDSLQTARAMRQPVKTRDDLHNYVDRIAYDKGTAVLTMFERWVGEERFRDGVRAYLAKHAWKNASAPDFFAVIGEVAGQDLAAPLATFIDQAGVPLVSMKLECDGAATPRLRLAQERYVPQGSQAPKDRTWKVPVCVRLGGASRSERRCTLLSEPTAEWKLDGVAACPTWVLPNADAAGYYRSSLEGPLLGRLLAALDGLSTAERLGVIGDVEALVGAGRVDVATALAFVPRYAAAEERYLVRAVAATAERIRDAIPPELAPNYARFVRKMFATRARALGWKPAAGEPDDTKLLRRTIVPLVTQAGEDKKLAAEARALALAWLEEPAAVDPEMVDAVLGSAAYHGDAALFDRYLAAAKKTEERRDRQRLLTALSGFRKPALVERAIGLATSGDFDTREAIGLFFGGLSQPATRPLVYAAVKAKYDVLVEKLPKPFTPYLVFAGVAQCDARSKADVEAFFKERTPKEPGGAIVYEQAMETMGLCIQQREAQRPGIAKFLKKY